MTRTIYLFRHGETEWNVAGKMQGRLDSPLTERGRQQALAHGRLLANLTPVECLWVSTANRTRATADLVNAAVNAPQHFSDALLERIAERGPARPRRRFSRNFPTSGHGCRATPTIIDRAVAKTFRI